jgi:hypothetical protein
MNIFLDELLFIRCLWKQMLHAKSFAEGLSGRTFTLHEKNEDIIRFRRKRWTEATAWENKECVENILKNKIKYLVQWIESKIQSLVNTVTDLEVCHPRCVKSIIQCIMCIYFHTCTHAIKNTTICQMVSLCNMHNNVIYNYMFRPCRWAKTFYTIAIHQCKC